MISIAAKKPIPFAEYQAIEAVNISSLKEMKSSPLHYRHALTHPRPDSPAMALGRAVHVAVLEPDEFPRRYVVMGTEKDRTLNRGNKEGKARFAEWLLTHPADIDLDADAYKLAVFKEANPGKEILESVEYDRCLAIRDAVRRHPVAATYLEAGEREVTIQWTERVGDPAMSIACKGRIDWVSESRKAIVDLKTTRKGVDSWNFGAEAKRMLMHAQMAWYHRGYEVVTGRNLACVLIAVETAAPHDVAVYTVEEDIARWQGEELNKKWLLQLKACRESGKWPGRFEQTEQPLKLASYSSDDEEGEV